jgi:L,D-peptidoglycan transpeptidase YkuD (ErfK/YbiS/YcfS/YnhG family)
MKTRKENLVFRMKRKILLIVVIFFINYIVMPKELIFGIDKTNTEKLKSILNSKQVVIVSVVPGNTYKVKINAYENIKGRWKVFLGPKDGVIGKNGFTKDKIEKDLKTPVGKFEFGLAFGKYDNPGTKLEYIKTGKEDFWIDDPNSQFYNTLQVNNLKKDWASAEKLLINSKLYDYAVDIKYNINPIIKGKGSAIFMHIWRGSNKYTTGCVATDSNTIIKLLKWLNPIKKPIIILGNTN